MWLKTDVDCISLCEVERFGLEALKCWNPVPSAQSSRGGENMLVITPTTDKSHQCGGAQSVHALVRTVTAVMSPSRVQVTPVLT
jgi:hypothetical protein